MGDQVKGRLPIKLKSLIERPYVAHLTVRVLMLNMNLFYSRAKIDDRGSLCSTLEIQVLSFKKSLIFLRSMFLDQVIHFGKNLGYRVKNR